MTKYNHMSELALQLIEESKRTKATYLDLGSCGFRNELPEELFECVWLEGLNLSSDYFDENGRYIKSNNKGENNYLQNCPDARLATLECIKRLYLSGLGIEDVSFLEQLTSLQSLNLRFNRLTDIS